MKLKMTGGWIILGVSELNGVEGRGQGEEQCGVGEAKQRIYGKVYENLSISKLASKHNLKNKELKMEYPAFNKSCSARHGMPPYKLSVRETPAT